MHFDLDSTNFINGFAKKVMDGVTIEREDLTFNDKIKFDFSMSGVIFRHIAKSGNEEHVLVDDLIPMGYFDTAMVKAVKEYFQI